MKYVDEYRDPELLRATLEEMRRTVTHPWTLMEICGGQTHSILQHGLDQLLPPGVELVHGPGCPVCVTPLEMIDKALAIAALPNVIFCSFGDMLRVPGSQSDLFSVRANGGDVRIVYAPLDALRIAQENPDKQVVFFAIGFETTAPANALPVLQAKAFGLKNFSVLVSQVSVPAAIRTILDAPGNRVQGFLLAGHVCAVMGYWEYLPIAEAYHVPMVVTGFEPFDICQGALLTVRQLEKGEHEVENAYSRAVTREGNRPAQALIRQVFEPCDRNWRGIGSIPASGLRLRPEFAEYDAERRFDVGDIQTRESPLCMAGQVLQGRKKPPECPAFGTLCTPQHPLGAPMVSAEGACAAYFRYRPPSTASPLGATPGRREERS
jgi:hydrogenase expression/formation protein HypD